MTIDQPSPDAVQRHLRQTSEDSLSTIEYEFAARAILLRSIKTSVASPSGRFDYECRFDRPVAFIAWPPSVGASFRGHASCGSFTLTIEGGVTGTESRAVAGQQVQAVVIETNFVTHGQVESTGKQRDLFSPDHRLVVHQEIEQRGSFGLIPFESNLVSDLMSLTPR